MYYFEILNNKFLLTRILKQLFSTLVLLKYLLICMYVIVMIVQVMWPCQLSLLVEAVEDINKVIILNTVQ